MKIEIIIIDWEHEDGDFDIELSENCVNYRSGDLELYYDYQRQLKSWKHFRYYVRGVRLIERAFE